MQLYSIGDGPRRQISEVKFLTAASLPVAETADTVRLDCRKAFLNIVSSSKGEL